jgi:RNA-binding protein
MRATGCLLACRLATIVMPMSKAPESNAGLGPAPASAKQRELRALANRLKARLIVGHKGLTDSLLAEVRGELGRSELIKVRLDEEDADAAELLAHELAERVPAHLIQRIGRVALLYRPKPAES